MEFDILFYISFIPLFAWIIAISLIYYDIKRNPHDDGNNGGDKHPVYPDDKGFSEEILVKYK
jgi:hypothetical protein